MTSNTSASRRSNVEGGKADPGRDGVARRSALATIGVAGVGAAALAACKKHEAAPRPPDDLTGLQINKPPVPGVERYGTYEERWVQTSCGQCPAGCGIRVRVVEGRAVRIEGNPDNPINEGGIGPRGLSSLQVLYDPDRIHGPLVRKDGQLVPVSWDEALGLLGGKLRDLRRKGAPHRLLVMTGRQRGLMHDLLARFARAYGTPNFVDGRPSRTSVLAQAMQATVGSFEIPSFGWSGAEYVLSLEAGLLEDSCQAVFFARSAGEMRRGPSGYRAKLVHVGPGFDLSAHNSDEWVPIRPGTSGALALGLCHLLLRDKRYDKDFVEKSTTGFADLEKLVAKLTPDRTYEATGVPPDVVVRIASEMAAAEHAFAFADERTFTYTNGWETALAVLSLNALLGAVGRREGGMRIEPRPPYAEWPAVDLDEVAKTGLGRPRIDGAGGAEFPLARSVLATLPGVIERGGDAKPEVALLHACNPAYARNQPRQWSKAFASIPFVVSFSPFRDETVEEVAHLVLPDHTFLERWDDAEVAPGIGRAVAGVRRPVVEPLHETRSSGDVILAVARKQDEPVARAFPWTTFKAAMEERLLGLHAAQRGTIVTAGQKEFLKRLYDKGFWADAEEQGNQKVQFKFVAAAAEPEWEGDPKEFPLGLIVYRPLGYPEGSGANQPWLRFLRPRPHMRYWTTPATIHPDSLPPGTHDDDEVSIETPYGAVTVTVRLDRTMQPGYVAVPEGGGHTAMGRWAKGFGANPMRLLKPAVARTSGATVICNTRARARLVRAHAHKREG